MKRASPLVQMTLALVGLCGTLVLLADLFFGVLPDRSAQAALWRKHVGEALAVQVAALLQSDDAATLQRTLDGVAARTEGVRSLAVRRADGRIVMQAGDHAAGWKPLADDASQPEQVTVPLNAAGSRWGSFEIAFVAESGHPVLRWLKQPLMVTLMFLSVAGTLLFGLYMRRALQHLDPASVIPERVQGAFDAMSEGVVVLDMRGRVMLANKAFRKLHVDAAVVGTGQALSALPWLAQSLPADLGAHPWTSAMSARAPSAGDTLEIAPGSADARHLVVNCAPVTDPAGHVRGCVVTFDDVSKLHHANEALHEALDELTASKEELQQQNVKLERLATRDPMTGCLNRRAFYEALDALLARARHDRSALSCVMVDIDHFKSVNDAHGHAVGDVVIQGVARLLLDSARSSDLVCRYGGEEFCVVLPGLGAREAHGFTERLRARIEAECGAGVREVPHMRVTASLGLAVLAPDVAAAPALIERADQALYRAKRTGRNRVCEYSADLSMDIPALPAPPPADGFGACLMPAAFQRAFTALLAEAQARGAVLSAVKLAVDPYRALLVAPGPAAADAALHAVIRIVRECCRPNDLLVRLDADHLGLVAADLGIQEALLFAERVRARVEAEPAGAAARGQPALTVTLGVDALPAGASGAPTLMERAGKALQRAKRDGANRVARFSPGTKTPDALPAEPAAALMS